MEKGLGGRRAQKEMVTEPVISNHVSRALKIKHSSKRVEKEKLGSNFGKKLDVLNSGDNESRGRLRKRGEGEPAERER